MNKITPCLWFDTQAGEAAEFYTSIFKNSKITSKSTLKDTGPSREETVMVVQFELEGQSFMAMNAGPLFKFNEAISLSIDCGPQEEVDYYWDKLTADGGQESMCGWLKDKYGVSWQVTPRILPQMLRDPDPAKAKRAMEAMLSMRKIDIPTLQRAYDGK